jgi:hypothetical protein
VALKTLLQIFLRKLIWILPRELDVLKWKAIGGRRRRRRKEDLYGPILANLTT